MKNYLFLVAVLLSLFSCEKKIDQTKPMVKLNNHESENALSKEYDNKNKMKILLDDAIIKGDSAAYIAAFKAFTLANRYNEFFYYSTMMAQRHGTSQAYFDCYYFLSIDYPGSYNDIETNKNLALYYLLKAYEKGNRNAKDEVKEKYQNKVPSSSEYLKNMMVQK